jgi:hypothetical protein
MFRLLLVVKLPRSGLVSVLAVEKATLRVTKFTAAVIVDDVKKLSPVALAYLPPELPVKVALPEVGMFAPAVDAPMDIEPKVPLPVPLPETHAP